MRRQILVIAILSVVMSPAASAKDLPPLATPADDSSHSATLEIIDQKETIKLTCETFEVQTWPPSEDDHGDATSVNCGGTSIDANSPLLWHYANKKQRLEKAALVVKYGKVQSYMVEMSNVVIAHLDLLGGALEINLSAASSRLVVLPRRQ
jgi:hypothetical protein